MQNFEDDAGPHVRIREHVCLGSEVIFSPGGHITTLQSLQSHGQVIFEGPQSSLITLVFGASLDLRRGLVISESSSPVTCCRSSITQLWLWNVGKLIKRDFTPITQCGTA